MKSKLLEHKHGGIKTAGLKSRGLLHMNRWNTLDKWMIHVLGGVERMA